MLTEMLTDEHSPFFQHFSLMELGPFSGGDGVGLLVNGAPEDRPIPRALAERAVAVIGTHPFYLQMLGEELTSLPPPYHESDLKHALQSLLFSRTGRLALYLENTFNALVGRSTYLSAALQALAAGPERLTDIARTIGAPTGSTVRYLERLGDAVTHAEGTYTLADPTFALWLRWRQPGGTVVPMTVIGDEAEQLVAHELSRMGFELVYQSRASRGAFDLLGIRGPYQVGIQVKRSTPPLRFKLGEWQRMQSDAGRFGWLWVIAAVKPSEEHRLLLLDPDKARIGKEVRLHGSAAIDNLLAWVESRKTRQR
jgi:hypothetical protein